MLQGKLPKLIFDPLAGKASNVRFRPLCMLSFHTLSCLLTTLVRVCLSLPYLLFLPTPDRAASPSARGSFAFFTPSHDALHVPLLLGRRLTPTRDSSPFRCFAVSPRAPHFSTLPPYPVHRLFPPCCLARREMRRIRLGAFVLFVRAAPASPTPWLTLADPQTLCLLRAHPCRLTRALDPPPVF